MTDQFQLAHSAQPEVVQAAAPFPQAETRRMLFHRISRFLEEIKDQEDTYLIVSHGNSITTAIFWWLELPLSAQSSICFDIDQCSITHLRINDWDQKTVSRLNSTDHLQSLLTEM